MLSRLMIGKEYLGPGPETGGVRCGALASVHQSHVPDGLNACRRNAPSYAGRSVRSSASSCTSRDGSELASRSLHVLRGT